MVFVFLYFRFLFVDINIKFVFEIRIIEFGVDGVYIYLFREIMNFVKVYGVVRIIGGNGVLFFLDIL